MSQPVELVQLGCDVARFGDDATVIHIRQGKRSLHHESYRKRDTAFTAERLKELCRQFASQAGRQPWEIPCLIDDTGVGGGVVDQRHSPPTLQDLAAGRPKGCTFWFLGVNAGQQAMDPDKYPNARSEALFLLAEDFKAGLVDLSGLPRATHAELERQATSIIYRLDPLGRRVAERKDVTKDRIHRSPDDLDGLALARYPLVHIPGPVIAIPKESIWGDDRGRGQSPRSPYARTSHRRTFG